MAPLDVHTLVLVSSLVLGALGGLFLINWWDDRAAVELRDWGFGFLLVVPGVILVGARGSIDDVWSIALANALMLSAYGFLATGVLRFDRRRPPPGLALAGAAVWGGLCLWPAFLARFDLRVIAISTIGALYLAASAGLLWRRRGGETLPSRGRAAVALGTVAAFLAARAGSMAIWPVEPVSGAEALRSGWLTWVSLALLVSSLVTAHLLLAMSTERANLRHRRRADSDDLTGILSRRAFVERAERQLAAAPATGTLMFFDIDHFKSINDAHGHAIGDEVLIAFARLVAARLGPDDLFARWGGEEFVLFLGRDDFVAGRRVAEEIRRAFAERVFDEEGAAFAATVSVGLAAPALAGPDLDRLIAWADAGVYAAKRAGRDRVEAIDETGAAPTAEAM
jgi:diguanylate cyclase (GGDEF)-like protein